MILHHSEPIDQTLLTWIIHEIDALVGLPPLAIIVGLGALVLILPLVLAAVVFFWRRGARGRSA